MYIHTYIYIYIYGFLVCRYASSLGLAARQNTPAIDGAFYRPNGTSYQLQPSFYTHSTAREPEPTASGPGARWGPGVGARCGNGLFPLINLPNFILASLS